MSAFITSTTVYAQQCSNLLGVIDSSVKLPTNPFRRQLQHFVFAEFDWAMSGEFAPFLDRLTDTQGEKEVALAVLEPDPVNYFYKEFRCFNWRTLRKPISSDEYWNALEEGPPGSPADAILFGSDRMAWFGAEKTWAIYGERNPGLCVIATSEKLSVRELQNEVWPDAESALTMLLTDRSGNCRVADSFATALRESFLKSVS